jgi:integrase
MNSYKIYCKKVESKSTKNKGLFYLYLYHHPSGKKHPTLSSLGIKIPKNYIVFEKIGKSLSTNSVSKIKSDLPNEYLLQTGFKNVNTLNKFLLEKLEEFVKINGRKEFIERDKKTLNEWFQILINGFENQGTLLRYTNIKNLLELFQSQRKGGNNTIYMNEVDIDFINQFRNWLKTEPQQNEGRKQNSSNSTIYKLKGLKSAINKSHYSKFYCFIVNPFDHIKFSEVNKPVKVLSQDELRNLMSKELVEVYRRKIPTKEGVQLWGKPIDGGVDQRNEKNKRYKCKHTLNDIRNYFLFQLFSQGLRISDLITLRWSHFTSIENDNLKIIKIMVKTRKEIKVFVNENLTSIIYLYLKRYDELFDEQIKNELKFTNENIKNMNDVIGSDHDQFISKEYLWWDHIPLEYRTILQQSKRHKKHDGTSIHGFLINENKIIEVETLLGPIDETDYNNKLPLKGIHEEFRKIQNKLHEIERNSNINIIEKETLDKEKRRLQFLIKKYFIKLIRIEYIKEKSNKLGFKNQKLEELLLKRHSLICKMITTITNHNLHSNDFVFELLDNKDFIKVEKDSFSGMNELQYRKFQSVRTYYNGLLKLIGDQCGLGNRLSSHVSRHTFTSITLDIIDNVSPFDLMNSLGHKNLSTTQSYMKKFSDKNVDRINQLVGKSMGTF